MKILTCPINGPRNISEFVWGGELKSMPDPATRSFTVRETRTSVGRASAAIRAPM